MINFDMSDRLLEKLNIYADKDIFSIMLNYIFNKYSKIYGKTLDIDGFNNDLYNVHKKYKDNISKKNSKNKEESKTIEFTVSFIDYVFKNIFQYINISIFLKMNLIHFKERGAEFNNYKLMTDFFDYIFINYGVNNYMDYLYQYKYIEPKIVSFGGEELKEDLSILFNGLGLNSLFCDRLNNLYAVRFANEVSSHMMFPMPKLSEEDRFELKECLIYNDKLCNIFDSKYSDDKQIMAADYMFERKLTRK